MYAELQEQNSIKSFQQIISSLRKIGDDIVLDVTSEAFSLRSLNATRSALPIVKLKSAFFRTYRYSSLKDSLAYQLPAIAMITAFKNVSSPSLLSFSLDDDTHCFVISMIDKYQIEHDWEFILEQSILMNAVYDINETTVNISCRQDVFDGLSVAFKGNQNIYLELNRNDKKKTLFFRSSQNEELVLSSTLMIHKSDKCETQICSSELEELKLSFNLSDFLVAIKLSKIFSQRMLIHLIAPGHPIIIKSQLANLISFEMALATAVDESQLIEEEAEMSTSQTPESVADQGNFDNAYSNNSQVTPWSRQKNIDVEKSPNNGITAFSPVMNANNPRMSQILAQNLFEASPQFPFKRKMTGQYAEASQPASDEDDSDV